MQSEYLASHQNLRYRVSQSVAFVFSKRQILRAKKLLDLLDRVLWPEIRSFHLIGIRRQVFIMCMAHRAPCSYFLCACSFVPQVAMPDCQSDSQRSARVAGSWLNPDVFKRSFAQDASIADTVQRDATGHAKPLQAGFLVNVSCHLQHHFFSDLLNASSKIHFALRYVG